MHFVTQGRLEESSTEKYQTLVDQVAQQTGALMLTAEQNLKMLSENPVWKNERFTDLEMMTEIKRLKEANSTFAPTHQHQIGLILMDMTMPRMSGLEAFRAMRAIYPTVPVVICSDYVVDLCEFQTLEGDCPNGFVQKPYRLQDLVSSVRSTIDASAPRPSRGPPSPRAPALAI